ncbi:hypothetical protein GCM10023187_48960 [Nibrella viscosa]|uniref:Protein-glutamine gamma-glutamyltransferase-like C-terminal domain-containing protein n=1 Tax=Nibrella viscosa TaxID=1084524 RepID=A0ABP8KW93_9BACT
MKAIIKLRLTGRLLVWLLLTVSPAVAQPAKVPTDTTFPGRDDRQPMQVRYPAAEKLQEYRTSRDYQYQRDTRPLDNPLLKFWFWIQKSIADFLRSTAYRNFWQYVFLAVIVGYSIYLLIKAEVLGFLLPRKAAPSPLPYEQVTSNIHEINFGEALDEVIRRGNYRLAVRLLYLRTLKQLTDQELIDWQPDKTNRQYVYELQTSPLQADFELLTTAFDFAWYGDFPVDQQTFERVQADFHDFDEQLQLHAKPQSR